MHGFFRRKIVEYLFPDRIEQGIYGVDFDALRGRGISGLILDIDNTLVKPGARAPNGRAADLLRALQDDGFSICLLSNSSRRRAAGFASGLGVYCVTGAGKPAKAGFLKAIRLLGLEPGNICVVGDQIFTDVWGAKRLGLMVIYTKPITKREELTVQVKRIPEKFILKFYNSLFNHNNMW